MQTEFEKSIFSKLCCELQVCKYFPFSAQTAYFSTLEEFSFTLFYFLSLFSTFTFLLSVYLSLSSLSYFLYSFPATLNLPCHNFLVFSYPLLSDNHHHEKVITTLRKLVFCKFAHTIIFIFNAHLHISGL